MATNQKRGVLRATGRAVKAVGRAYVWSITGNWDERKQEMARLRAGIARLLNGKYRVETFDEAVARRGVSEADLQRQARELSALGMLYGMVSLLAVLFACGAGLTPHPWNHLVTAAGVFVVAFSKFLGTRFRVAQIERRQLFSFKDWLTRRHVEKEAK